MKRRSFIAGLFAGTIATKLTPRTGAKAAPVPPLALAKTPNTGYGFNGFKPAHVNPPIAGAAIHDIAAGEYGVIQVSGMVRLNFARNQVAGTVLSRQTNIVTGGDGRLYQGEYKRVRVKRDVSAGTLVFASDIITLD